MLANYINVSSNFRAPSPHINPVNLILQVVCNWGADKPLARPTSRCILFDGQNISFDVNLVLYIYINSTNIPPITIISRIHENRNLLSL